MTKETNLKTVVYQRLEAIANAEKITRKELAELSRELLMYVPDSNDIDIVNRLLGILTPMNTKTCILYFKHFLPWQAEEHPDGTFSRFGKKMDGDKKVKRRMDLIAEWLKSEENTVWTWAEANVTVDQKKDFPGMIANAIKKAFKGDKKTDTPALTHMEVLEACFAGGVTLDDLLTGIAVKEAAAKAAAEVIANAQGKKQENPVEQKEAA
ncbi:hypothetical protein KDA08_03615 [Candidatus Saccharibacteria bacterium]|nr:hypothetical protein [Candidatus Saccharibacteria bacterium]